MGSGGQCEVVKGQVAAADAATKNAVLSTKPTTTTTDSTKTNNNIDGAWVSPFTPDKIDPTVSSMSLKEINAQFPTKSELRAVIPPHCFERSLFWSFYSIGRDLFMSAIVAYITYHTLSVDPPEGGLLGNPVGWIAWRLAWNVYALFMTAAYGGLWVIGHECGHGAFSDYPIVNDIVGWILHSSILVPYFTWAFSHAKHHRRTNDLIEGETHVPPDHKEMGLIKNDEGTYERLPKEVIDSKLSVFAEGGLTDFFSHFHYGHALCHEHNGDEAFSCLMLWSRLFMGFQLYVLGIGSNGHLGSDGKWIEKGTFPDHFRPWSRLFPEKMYWKVVASDIGCLITLSILAYCSYLFGVRAVWFWYGGPYLLINATLVTFTWLQHTDPTVPHFDADNWNWIKGALAGTIDRPLHPPMGVSLSHHIVTTHVCHHLFHEIPHYHAVEATAHIRAYLEPKGLYNYDPTPMASALWKVASTCHFVDSLTDGVQYYRNFREVPLTTEATQNNKSKKTQ
ncbi:Delta(12) acyl-lipid conjugase (11E,13E-forming) [Seminavis robusta]|uniref:Delta(12) acyl-lipid conjugase (11E,13E-forming) n=1 Tax=Seminavis robusta TaxID=568900 RepID=A0A9N8DFB7_9STRA|nr:Delta(12) acyl-lipid conjugase (11E,13E-forming) [Seminavis robusta]|eukprot:Sro116_g057200.1 Delta(12) acyl-lipid conjugase (11E,13E-forming) (507) ;mRNA; r:104297-105941